jgi:hypothetical protein
MMDLKQQMEDFRQLQTHRKQIKKHKIIENIKMAHSARVQVSEGTPLIRVQIFFVAETQTITIRERNDNQLNGLHLYRATIYKEEIETYRSEHDEIEINFYEEVGKLSQLLIFDNSAQRAQFETALRFFMECR